MWKGVTDYQQKSNFATNFLSLKRLTCVFRFEQTIFISLKKTSRKYLKANSIESFIQRILQNTILAKSLYMWYSIYTQYFDQFLFPGKWTLNIFALHLTQRVLIMPRRFKPQEIGPHSVLLCMFLVFAVRCLSASSVSQLEKAEAF